MREDGLTFCGHPGDKQRDQNDNPSGSFGAQIHGEAAEEREGKDNLSSPAPREVCPTPAGARQRGGRRKRREAGAVSPPTSERPPISHRPLRLLRCRTCEQTLIFVEQKVKHSHILVSFYAKRCLSLFTTDV